MQEGKTIINRVAQGIEPSAKTSATEAGPTRTVYDEDKIDAINQIFALFRLNYHNQYYKAFPDESQLGPIKKLWLESLGHLSTEHILRAAKRAIAESEYLPTLNTLLRSADDELDSFGLPDAHAAYVEACRAPSPRVEFDWSHPAVYHAGRESDWYFLASSPESQAYPVFERNYRLLCRRVIAGEALDMPVPKALPEETHTPLSREERAERMKALRDEVGL